MTTGDIIILLWVADLADSTCIYLVHDTIIMPYHDKFYSVGYLFLRIRLESSGFFARSEMDCTHV